MWSTTPSFNSLTTKVRKRAFSTRQRAEEWPCWRLNAPFEHEQCPLPRVTRISNLNVTSIHRFDSRALRRHQLQKRPDEDGDHDAFSISHQFNTQPSSDNPIIRTPDQQSAALSFQYRKWALRHSPSLPSKDPTLSHLRHPPSKQPNKPCLVPALLFLPFVNQAGARARTAETATTQLMPAFPERLFHQRTGLCEVCH